MANNFFNGWALFGLRVSLIPLYVVEGLELGAQWIGWGLLVSAAVQAVFADPGGRLADNRGRKPFLLLGAGLSLASMLLLAAVETPATYLLSMALFGVGSAFIGTAAAASSATSSTAAAASRWRRSRWPATSARSSARWSAGCWPTTYSFAVAFGATAAIAGVAVGAAAVMPETLPTRLARAGRQPHAD